MNRTEAEPRTRLLSTERAENVSHYRTPWKKELDLGARTTKSSGNKKCNTEETSDRERNAWESRQLTERFLPRELYLQFEGNRSGD